MILYDFSSLLVRSVFTATKNVNPHKKDGKYVTDDYIAVAIFRIINELIDSYKTYHSEYGEMILCMDDSTKQYWRKEFYPPYKSQRKKERDESEINWNEVYKHIDVLSKVLDQYSPFKSFSTKGAEADDIIFVLTKRHAMFENVLILSPDKDFKQLQRLGQVKQYSALTNEWIQMGNESLTEWKNEHIILGDVCDGVPKIVDNLKFSENFKTYLHSKNLDINEEQYDKLGYQNQQKLLEDYNIFKYNKKGEPTTLDIFETVRFGKTNILKMIKEYGTIENWLDSNPLLRSNYERNKILVLDETIPQEIEIQIMKDYNNGKTEFHLDKLEKYFMNYNLRTCVELFRDLAHSSLPKVELTIDNCGW